MTAGGGAVTILDRGRVPVRVLTPLFLWLILRMSQKLKNWEKIVWKELKKLKKVNEKEKLWLTLRMAKLILKVTRLKTLYVICSLNWFLETTMIIWRIFQLKIAPLISNSYHIKLRDVISKIGQISPWLFRTQFLFGTKIKSTCRIVLPSTWILDYNFWTFYQFSGSLPFTIQHIRNLEVHFFVYARYDPF